MRIVLWSTTYFPLLGGLEVMTHNLAKELTRSGHQLIVIATNPNSNEFKQYELDGISIYLFPFLRAIRTGNLLLVRKILMKVSDLLTTFSPDLINVHGWYETFSFYQVRALKNYLVWLSIHGLLEQAHYRTAACMSLWHLAKGVNTVSAALLKPLAQEGFEHANLHVIYNGAPLPEMPIQPICIEPPSLLLVGRLSPEKCFNVALHACKHLLPQYPNLQIRLAGDGPLLSELTQLAAQLGLQDHLNFLGKLPPQQIAEQMDTASIILIPSDYESFCLVALEAALRARPVIASNVWGLREVVLHQETGLLIEPHHPEQLAESIHFLLSNPQEMQRLGQQAYARATQHFSISQSAAKYCQLYQQILEQVS